MPGFAVWVEVMISTCAAATFEAPSDHEVAYVPNDTHRTALISGYVHRAGFIGQPLNAKLEALRTERASLMLPATNSRIALVLPRWEDGVCKKLGPLSKMPVKRFRFNYNCDTNPRRGSCLPPLQLADMD